MFEIKWIFYGLSRMLQFSQFVRTPCYSVWDVFNNFLLINATDRSKISSDQKRFFIALSLYPLSFFAKTPCKKIHFHPFLFLKIIYIHFFVHKNPLYLSCSITHKTNWITILLKRPIFYHFLYKSLSIIFCCPILLISILFYFTIEIPSY